jgi:phosphopantothenoylcysteine decarboxylase/phosphopantothenate--cysteine ligase
MSTGRLGIEIAKEAYGRNYSVHLLYGAGLVKPPAYIPVTRFTTTINLLEEVLKRIKDTDIFISSAAVSDYTPIPQDKKISSCLKELVIKLKPTPKVIKEAKLASRPGTIFIAFKLGYNLPRRILLRQAVKAYKNTADMIVANDLKDIREDSHKAFIIYKGRVVDTGITKQEIAGKIFDHLEKYCI